MKSIFILSLAVLSGTIAPMTSRGQIAGILTPLAPAVASSASSPLPSSSKVTVMRLSETELCERLAGKLTEKLSLTDGELSLSVVARWTPVELSAGTWEVTLLDAPDLKKLTSSFLLRFRLEAGQRIVGEWQMAVHAQLNQEVWAATRQLTRGETPDPVADLEKRRLNVLAERQVPIAARCPLDGYEFAQTVAAGQPLTWRDLCPRVLVHRGQSVDVVASGGPFSISMKALALQDGSNGANVRVRNQTSQRDIDAQVVGDGKVKVSF